MAYTQFNSFLYLSDTKKIKLRIARAVVHNVKFPIFYLMIDFTNIEYLNKGNRKQKKAYSTLNELKIFERLKKYNPILTGTIPIEIDLPESDLDIICKCENHKEFSNHIKQFFSERNLFEVKTVELNRIKTTIAKFETNGFQIEIFGQNIPTREQMAYLHMIIEDKILKEKGKRFKSEIIKLKSEGLKTEPAFAKLLELDGNPYEALLKVKLK